MAYVKQTRRGLGRALTLPNRGRRGFGDLAPRNARVASWLGDDVPLLPPMPDHGEAGEEVTLLRRVAAAQEAFNRQDLKMRKWQLAATVAIPAAAQAWAWVWEWLKRRRAA